MPKIPHFSDKLELQFQLGDKSGTLIILPIALEGPERFPFNGEYMVFYHHPFYRSVTFIIDQDANERWYCGIHPPYVSEDFISWIGKQIERLSNLIERVRP